MSSISRLPYHYLLGTPESVPPSGESLKASEAGLERKTERAQLFLGEGWEEVLRVAFLAMGDQERGRRARGRDDLARYRDPRRGRAHRCGGETALRRASSMMSWPGR